jgi:glycosyltransferase involved in cell wall biosynthesis
MSGALSVLHVIPAVAPRYGGPSEAVIQYCRALQARGVSTMMATTDADGPARLDVPRGREIEYAGTPAVFFARRLGDGFKYSPGLAAWLPENVRRFDLVHVHALFSHSSLAAARACRRARVPYVVRPLGSLTEWGLRRHRWRKRLLWQAGVARMLHGAALVHYTTADEQAQAQAVTPAPGVVVPVGIADDWPAGADIGRAEPVVLAVGRLHPVKNLELLIAAFQDVVVDSRFGAWRLVIAGDGDAAYRATLERLGRARPARVEFAGWLDAGAKAAWLERTAIFASTSHQESFGLALIEALASGRPAVIADTLSLAGEIREAEAGWVAPASRDGVAEALRQAMTDAAERVRRGSAARAFARQFTWPAIAVRLEDAYRSAIDAGRVPAPKRDGGPSLAGVRR